MMTEAAEACRLQDHLSKLIDKGLRRPGRRGKSSCQDHFARRGAADPECDLVTRRES
jgi:hypothetical protein